MATARSQRGSIAVRGRATAALTVADGAAQGITVGCPAFASGGGYDGPLAYRMGKPMRPDVAQAFDRMAAAARREGTRSRSPAVSVRRRAGAPVCRQPQPEVGRYARYEPAPLWHRTRPRPPGAYAWLEANARRFGFIHRYGWEPWH